MNQTGSAAPSVRLRVSPPAACHSAQGFLLWHALLIPGALALAGYAAHTSGWDLRISAWCFDAASGTFPAKASATLELLGHKLAKSAMLLLWGLLLAAAVATRWLPKLQPHRRTLWLTVAAMALGPSLVVVLKDINTMGCPWDLTEFGGNAHYRVAWFVGRAESGRCFPGGHAAGGFSAVALVFAAQHLRRPDWQRLALALTLVCGIGFSLVRVLQGAHFVSHNLWAAAIDWWAAAAVFAPALLAAARQPQPTRTQAPAP